jgi:hypothetical protein
VVLRETLESRAAERLTPSEADGFFEEFWVKAETVERRAARRWRRIAVVATAVAIACACAAGVFAFGSVSATHTLDRTFLCSANDQGGVRLFDISLEGTARSGSFSIWTPPLFILEPGKIINGAGFHGNPYDGRINANPSNCTATTRKIALARSGVPVLTRTISTPQTPSIDQKLQCWVNRAYIRARVVFDSKNRPLRSTLAVRNARTMKPLLYAEMTPPKVQIYAAQACRNG